jgi:hypothetical protein
MAVKPYSFSEVDYRTQLNQLPVKCHVVHGQGVLSSATAAVVTLIRYHEGIIDIEIWAVHFGVVRHPWFSE